MSPSWMRIPDVHRYAAGKNYDIARFAFLLSLLQKLCLASKKALKQNHIKDGLLKAKLTQVVIGAH